MNWSKEKQGSGCTYYEINTPTMHITLCKFTESYLVRVTIDNFGTIIKEYFDIENFGDDKKAKQDAIKIVISKLGSNRDYWGRLFNEVVLNENL